MSKTRNTARTDRKGNARQKGENHNRDQRLDRHDAALSSHQGQIDSEKSTRQSADSNLHGRVDNEATARSNKDSNLDNQTQALRDRASALESFQGRPAGFAGNPHGDNQHTENYAKAANVYAQSTTDNRFLKSDKHPQFTKGHGNGHHDPDFAVAGKSGSIPFKSLPTAERQTVLNNRAFLRDSWSGATTAQRLEGIRSSLLDIYHMIVDSPEDTGEELHARMAADSEFQDVLISRQGEELDRGSYYIANPGPDNNGGTPEVRFRSAVVSEVESETQIICPQPKGVGGDIVAFIVLSGPDSTITAPLHCTQLLTDEHGDVRLYLFLSTWANYSEANRTFTSDAADNLIVCALTHYRVSLGGPVPAQISGSSTPTTSLQSPAVNISQTRTTLYHVYACDEPTPIRTTLNKEQSVFSYVGLSKSLFVGLRPMGNMIGASPAGTAACETAAAYVALTAALKAA